MPPLPADSIHARACKLKCEKILTRPITFLAVTNSFQSGSGRENTVSSMDNDDSQNRKKPVFDRSQKQVSSPGDGYKKDAVVAGLHQKPNRNPAKRLRFGKEPRTI